jgi:tRNA (guanine-N7-)-methyltransferase
MIVIPATRGKYREHLRDEFAAFPFPTLSKWFGNAKPTALEIGCGEGHWVVEQARAQQHRNYIAMDNNLERMAVGLDMASGLAPSDRVSAPSSTPLDGPFRDTSDLRWVLGDANFFLWAVPHQYDAVYLNFPDPWSSKLSSWRRLLSPAFVQLVHQRLKVGGRLHVVTDNRSYVNWALQSVQAADCEFVNVLPAPGFVSLPTDYGYSAFREQWEVEGRDCYYMEWSKTAESSEALLGANRAFDFGRAKLPELQPTPASSKL